MSDDIPVLACRISGSRGGQTILLLHGFTGCKEDWDDFIVRLPVTHRALAVDLPGHGESGSVAEKWFAIPRCAESIVATLDANEIERCDVVGYSMGGRLAIYLLTNYAERFGRAVLESTTAGIDDGSERAARRAIDELRAQEIVTGSLTSFLMNWYDQPMFAGMRRRPERFEYLLQRRLRADREGLATSLRLMGTGAQESLWGRLQNIDQELLLIAGQFDGKFRAIAERMCSLCPHAQVRIIPGSGHNVHFEQPEHFYTEVESFLISRTS